MPIIDKTYGRLPVVFPDRPYATNRMFAAYITSYLPRDPMHRAQRLTDLHQQLRWWRLMTDVPVHVLASGWTPSRIAADPELARLHHHGGGVEQVRSQSINLNRIACLEAFYASDYPWGIIMDDDAILYHSPAHNSGGAFFSEMAQNPPSLYSGVDVFYPINPQKRPGQNQIWQKAPTLYRTHHVFDAGYDLKGSLFIVRNFRLDGRAPILPPAKFNLIGEDTLFAIEAVANGCSVFRCGNLVLKELSGKSHFQHTPAQMQAGNQAIAAMYATQNLRMNTAAGRTHLLDRSAFISRYLPNARRQVRVGKP